MPRHPHPAAASSPDPRRALTDAECVAAVRDYLRGGVDQLARATGVPFPGIFDQAEAAIRANPDGFPHPNPRLRDYYDAEHTLQTIRNGRHDMTSRWCQAVLSGAPWHAGPGRTPDAGPRRRT